MSWGRIEDKLYRNAKFVELRATPEGRDAYATWLHFYSWCLDTIALDGAVPRTELNRADESAAEVLVRVGLWRRTKTGFLFHDFEQYAKSPKRLERDRLAAAERKRRQREREAAAGAVTDVSRRDMQRDNHRDTGTPVSRIPIPEGQGTPDGVPAPSASQNGARSTSEKPKKPRKGSVPDTPELAAARTRIREHFLGRWSSAKEEPPDAYDWSVPENAMLKSKLNVCVKRFDGDVAKGEDLFVRVIDRVYVDRKPDWIWRDGETVPNFRRFCVLFQDLVLAPRQNGAQNGTQRGGFVSGSMSLLKKAQLEIADDERRAREADAGNGSEGSRLVPADVRHTN